MDNKFYIATYKAPSDPAEVVMTGTSPEHLNAGLARYVKDERVAEREFDFDYLEVDKRDYGIHPNWTK